MKLVPVTKKHIDVGVAESCDSCPVALALICCARFGVNVGCDTTLLDDDIREHSDEVRWWIDDFDDDEEPPPLPVTLVLEANRLLTLAEWQQEKRP